MKAVHGVNEVPNPSFVTVIASNAVAIDTTPSVTTLLTATGIKGGDVAKKIEFTTEMVFTGAEGVNLFLYRDGVQIGETFSLTAPDVENKLFTVHWVDTAPGKGEPVYSVRADSVAGEIATVLQRRLTISNI